MHLKPFIYLSFLFYEKKKKNKINEFKATITTTTPINIYKFIIFFVVVDNNKRAQIEQINKNE